MHHQDLVVVLLHASGPHPTRLRVVFRISPLICHNTWMFCLFFQMMRNRQIARHLAAAIGHTLFGIHPNTGRFVLILSGHYCTSIYPLLFYTYAHTMLTATFLDTLRSSRRTSRRQ